MYFGPWSNSIEIQKLMQTWYFDFIFFFFNLSSKINFYLRQNQIKKDKHIFFTYLTRILICLKSFLKKCIFSMFLVYYGYLTLLLEIWHKSMKSITRFLVRFLPLVIFWKLGKYCLNNIFYKVEYMVLAYLTCEIQ